MRPSCKWTALRRTLARLAAVLLGAMLGLGGSPALAASTYVIDQRYGTLGFEVDEAGVFTSKGVFRRFAGDLTLDFLHPERSRIDVYAAAASADIPGPGALEMLRSPAYFDTGRYPSIHFVSTTVTPLGGDRFHIDGRLEIRGISLPQAFDASLTERQQDPASGGDVADFLVTGGLLRSRFGMVADANFISDTVRLVIRVHLTLGPDAHAP